MSSSLHEVIIRAAKLMIQNIQRAGQIIAKPHRDAGRILDETVTTLRDKDRLNLSEFRDNESRFSRSRSEEYPAYVPSAAERKMRERRLTREDELTDSIDPSTNYVYVMRSKIFGRTTLDSLSIYKPASGERFGGRDWLPHRHGELAKREVGAFRMDQLFKFGRVPPTALTSGPHGPGMVQQFMEFKRGKREHEYDHVQQQQVAVLHYVIGNGDGHRANYRPDVGDNLVAFDHGYSFPETPDPTRGDRRHTLRSDFVILHAGKALDKDVLRAVDEVDQAQVRSALGDLQLDRSAIDGAVERLNMIKTHRMIPPL
ncbi:hypothetical protein AB0C34_25390 [Nocardia sp. NPDC049220]|uniref:hypothetical protein n=1 Tax=Nocardia sp. NPDC049220 TaxID=3155273 RepID=UPI0033E352D2